MVFGQSLNAITSPVKLVNFGHDRFKSHGSASFGEAKEGDTSDGLLSSENLKEEKGRNRPRKQVYHAVVQASTNAFSPLEIVPSGTLIITGQAAAICSMSLVVWS